MSKLTPTQIQYLDAAFHGKSGYRREWWRPRADKYAYRRGNGMGGAATRLLDLLRDDGYLSDWKLELTAKGAKALAEAYRRKRDTEFDDFAVLASKVEAIIPELERAEKKAREQAAADWAAARRKREADRAKHDKERALRLRAFLGDNEYVLIDTKHLDDDQLFDFADSITRIG